MMNRRTVCLGTRTFELLLLCLVAVMAVNTTFAQGTSPFYPLQVRDYWEYVDYGWMGVVDDSGSVLVLRDTMIAEKSYRILLNRSFRFTTQTSYAFRKIDELGNVMEFDQAAGQEHMLYRLADTSKNAWASGSFLARFDTLRTELVFSTPRKVLRISFYSQSDTATTRVLFIHELAEGIGLCHVYADGLQGSSLLGARVGGIQYGLITSVTPVRPIASSMMPTLYQNFPNPFNPSTTISFSVPNDGLVTLRILNILGQQVDLLIHEEASRGRHSIIWNSRDLPSGVYFCRLQFSQFSTTRKLLLVR
jgi:hypothetical protein